MPLSALERFSTAWQNAASVGRVPTLDDVRKAGASLDHPGFAIIGRWTGNRGTVKPERPAVMFQVLQAGPDHARQGGHILAGHRLDELVHPARLSMLLDVYQSICQQGSLHRWHCINMARNAPPVRYTRVLGAIADDVGDGRCLCGVWVWHPRDAVMPMAGGEGPARLSSQRIGSASGAV